MRWRRSRVVLGAVMVVGITWGLQGMLQQSAWAQQTTNSWGLLRFHTWFVLVLGGVGGWFLGRLGSGWTGRRAAQADVQAARYLLTQEQASWHEQQTTERAQLAQAWAEVTAAQQAAYAAAETQRQRHDDHPPWTWEVGGSSPSLGVVRRHRTGANRLQGRWLLQGARTI